jgi:hypothetical protein
LHLKNLLLLPSPAQKHPPIALLSVGQLLQNYCLSKALAAVCHWLHVMHPVVLVLQHAALPLLLQPAQC